MSVKPKKLGVEARSKIWGSVTYSLSQNTEAWQQRSSHKSERPGRWTLAATVRLLRGRRVVGQSGSGRSRGNSRVGLKSVWHLVANDVHQTFKCLLDVDVVLCACLKKLKSFWEREIYCKQMKYNFILFFTVLKQKIIISIEKQAHRKKHTGTLPVFIISYMTAWPKLCPHNCVNTNKTIDFKHHNVICL